jgi:hypothetical protein
MPKLGPGYEELKLLDAALLEAEAKLSQAHLARGRGARPEVLYRDVVALRAKSRQLLSALGDMLVDRPDPPAVVEKKDRS